MQGAVRTKKIEIIPVHAPITGKYNPRRTAAGSGAPVCGCPASAKTPGVDTNRGYQILSRRHEGHLDNGPCQSALLGSKMSWMHSWCPSAGRRGIDRRIGMASPAAVAATVPRALRGHSGGDALRPQRPATRALQRLTCRDGRRPSSDPTGQAGTFRTGPEGIDLTARRAPVGGTSSITTR